MGFAEELVKRRKMANMTQEELAEKCNVSRQAITKWEKNESLPDVYMISKLANMFDVSIEELIYSRELGILENRNYYVRLLEEKDKADFCNLMREHRYMGKMLKFIDKMGNDLMRMKSIGIHILIRKKHISFVPRKKVIL